MVMPNHMPPTTSHFPPEVRRRVSWAGVAAMVGGGVGAAASILLLFVAPAVAPGVYNYPLTGGAFMAVQALFVVVYLVLAYGLMGLWWARVVPPSTFGSSGALAAVGSLMLLAVVHAVSLAAVGWEDTTLFVDILDASFGVVAAASGLSLILTGITVIRGQAWSGPGAFVPLAMGIYVFAVLIPALLGSTATARVAVAGWCLLFVLLGVALRTLVKPPRRTPVRLRRIRA